MKTIAIQIILLLIMSQATFAQDDVIINVYEVDNTSQIDRPENNLKLNIPMLGIVTIKNPDKETLEATLPFYADVNFVTELEMISQTNVPDTEMDELSNCSYLKED
jgi:hypothetical protein